jgi:hypothetical protein
MHGPISKGAASSMACDLCWRILLGLTYLEAGGECCWKLGHFGLCGGLCGGFYGGLYGAKQIYREEIKVWTGWRYELADVDFCFVVLCFGSFCNVVRTYR